MGDEQRPQLDAATYPTLAAFMAGYLHEDYTVVHGSLGGAAREWRADAGDAAASALVDDWRRFLAATRGWSLAWRAAALADDIGGAWSPGSPRDLAALSRAVVAAARRRPAPKP